MAYNDPQLVHFDRVLTGISVGYQNDDFVADELFPTVRVSQQSDKYNVFEKKAFNTYDDRRAPGALASELPPRSLSRDTFFAEEHALVDIVPSEEVENQDAGMDTLADSTEELTSAILLGKEVAAATLATTVANYATGHSVTLSGTDQWSDYANSDPIGDAKTGRDKLHLAIVKMPTVVVAGYQVMAKLEDHTDFIERIKYGGKDSTTDDIIARVLGMPRIVRAKAHKNTAAAGQAVTTSYAWGKDFVMAFVPPRPGRKIPAFAYEFLWPYRRGVRGRGGRDMPTERWHDDDRDAEKLRVRRRYDLKPIAVDAVATGKIVGGYLIKNAVA